MVEEARGANEIGALERAQIAQAADALEGAAQVVRELRRALVDKRGMIDRALDDESSKWLADYLDSRQALERIANSDRPTMPEIPVEEPQFCEFEDCDLDVAPGSTLCQGHIDENARIEREQGRTSGDVFARPVPAEDLLFRVEVGIEDAEGFYASVGYAPAGVPLDVGERVGPQDTISDLLSTLAAELESFAVRALVRRAG